MLEAPEIAVLNPAEGYARWAPTYAQETVVSLLDDTLVAGLTPPLARRRLLDIGCGTGRRMLSGDAASATGVEPSWEMIAAGAPTQLGRADLTVLQGHAGELPVADRAFDVAWCRLVLGHVADLATPYAEMARALVPGGTAIVSDFHPAAHAHGHRRTFRGATDVYEIESHPHAIAEHILAAEDAGLVLVDGAEAQVGPSARPMYEQAGRLAQYEQHLGLALVFALRFERV